MTNFLKKIQNLKNKIFLSAAEKKYIEFNKKIFKIYKKNNESNDQILVELFDYPTLIYFWSIIVNYISVRNNLKIKYYYFKTYDSLISLFKLFIKNLSIIYNSFNVEEGLNYYKFKEFKKKNFCKELFRKIKTKKKLENFKYCGIKIGDLIYDTYLRSTLKPTVNLEDPKLLEIFITAVEIFDNAKNYFNNNNVKLLITSHSYYIQHGIILRIALKKSIPSILVHNKAKANADFRLNIIDKKYPFEHNWGYTNYHKNFLKLKNKKKLLKIGRKLIVNRISGYKKLSYLKISPYKRCKFKKNNLLKNLNKKNIVIFAHCFFDAVHRFRYSIFTDYYEQINYFINLSEKYKSFNWFIKLHPNDLPYNDIIYKNFLKNKKNITIIEKNTPNSFIIDMKPILAITNNGSIAHEFAYLNIPVINTGDNVHINYNFCLHPKNKTQLLDMIININKYKNKLNMNKIYLYEFMYMHYEYPLLKNDEKKFLKDKFFATKNFNYNSTDKIYKYYIKHHSKNICYIEKYLSKFIINNRKNLKLNN